MKCNKLRHWWVFAFSVVCFGVTCVCLLRWLSIVQWAGPEHNFTVAPNVMYLTDELAVAKVTETLVLDGYDTAHWEMVLDGRTKAPNGSTDKYLFRCNKSDPNR